MSYVSQISKNKIEDSIARETINSLIDEITKLNNAVDALCDVIRGLNTNNAIKQKFYKKIYEIEPESINIPESYNYVGEEKKEAIQNLRTTNIDKLITHEDSNIF